MLIYHWELVWLAPAASTAPRILAADAADDARWRQFSRSSASVGSITRRRQMHIGHISPAVEHALLVRVYGLIFMGFSLLQVDNNRTTGNCYLLLGRYS